MTRLAVIPSDRLEDYARSGYAGWLEEYYNPAHFFEEVYVLSPLEREAGTTAGMTVVPTPPERLARRIRELKIDIVRAYGGYWPCDVATRYRANGVPVVVSVHDQRPEMLSSSIRRADFVFCVSESVERIVLETYPRRDRVWLLPNRVNFAVMRPTQKNRGLLAERFPRRFNILHVGRKSPEKNLDTVIRALKVLGEDFGLIAAGMGAADDYAELARQEGVDAQCHFLGAIRNEELPEYYSWADCMCVPSRCEGFGIVFIEALACAAVVVTSDREPMNRYIGHMVNGLLVRDYENPFAVAEMIRWACTDRRLRERLRANARQSVENFEKKKIDVLETEYYRRILSRKDASEFLRPLWSWPLDFSPERVKDVLPGALRNAVRLTHLFPGGPMKIP